MSDLLQTFLNSTPSDTPDPVLLPPGVYDFTIKSYRVDGVGENNTPIIKFNSDAVDVVETDEDNVDLAAAKTVRKEYWGTDKAIAHDSINISLKQFLSNTLDMSTSEIGGIDYPQLLEMTIGRRYRGVVEHKMVGKDNNILIAEVTRVLAA